METLGNFNKDNKNRKNTKEEVSDQQSNQFKQFEIENSQNNEINSNKYNSINVNESPKNKNDQIILYHKLHSNNDILLKKYDEDNPFQIPINDLDLLNNPTAKIKKDLDFNLKRKNYSNENENNSEIDNNIRFNNLNKSDITNISQISDLPFNIKNDKVNKIYDEDISNVDKYEEDNGFSDIQGNISPRFPEEDNAKNQFYLLQQQYNQRKQSEDAESKKLKVYSGKKIKTETTLEYKKTVYENFVEIKYLSYSSIHITNQDQLNKEILFVKMNEDYRFQLTLSRQAFNYYRKKVDFNNLSKFITDLNDCFVKNCENQVIEIESKYNKNMFCLFTCLMLLFLLYFFFVIYVSFKDFDNINKILCIMSVIFSVALLLYSSFRIKKFWFTEKEEFVLGCKNHDEFCNIINRWTTNYFSKFRIEVILPIGFKYFGLCFNKKIEYIINDS